MVDPTSVLIGAAALYAVVLHMIVAYQYATAQAGARSVSASEADIMDGGGQ